MQIPLTLLYSTFTVPRRFKGCQTHTPDYGCVLAVPMLRDGQPVGAITVGREAARPFSDAQIELLKTFADQAVIAIEHVRLFKELEFRRCGRRYAPVRTCNGPARLRAVSYYASRRSRSESTAHGTVSGGYPYG